MKLKTFFPAVALVSWIASGPESRADITLNYDFSDAATVPDGFGQLSSVKTLGGLAGMTDINQVVTRLNLTTTNANDPMFLGDLYSSLTLGNSSETQRIAVLLNRPGRNDVSTFGSSLSSLNVTLNDSSAGTNVWSATSGTGTYNSDGRLSVDPNAAGVAFASGSNSLTALEGATLASNRVSLLVADFSQGGTATLSNWGVSITGTAATSGTFTPGANASISDSGPGTTTVGAILNTNGASGVSAGNLTLDLAGTMIFSNGVTGSAGLHKTGDGTLVLEGNSSYSGATVVNSGKLTVNGGIGSSSGVSIGSGATLGGSGTVGALVTSGNLTPGGTGVDIQTLSAGTTTWNGSSSLWSFDLSQDAGSSDKLAITGDFTKGSEGAYRFDFMGSAPTAWGSAYTLVTWTGMTNFVASDFTFQGLTGNNNGLNSYFTISGNSLTFTAVPEPSSALAGLLIAAGLLHRRRVV